MLPDWWQDGLAEVEANRVLAETYISRVLGFRLEELRDPLRPLSSPSSSQVKFKRYKNQVDDSVRASAWLAQRAGAAFLRAAKGGLEPFAGPLSAREIRDQILERHRAVDLASLLECCWQLGVPVLHLAHVPARAKRFDGMAAWVESRPLIVLASGRDGEPWLTFYLAHELGHVMLGHVSGGHEAWVDGSLASATGTSSHEREADEFACELLSGFRKPVIHDLKATGPKLAVIAERASSSQGIDPGVFALIYAKSNDRWGVAQEALKVLDLAQGGQARISEYVERVLRGEQHIPETDERLLETLKAA